MSGEAPHSPEYERYRHGMRYFTKNFKSRIYLLYRAAMEQAHSDDFTAEELEELTKLAFPGWEGDGDG